MSGYEKYVAQAADEITYHPGNRTGTPESRHAVSVMLARAVLAAVGPLIEEDTRDRMVTAAGAALEREGCGEQAIRAKVAEEIATALDQRARDAVERATSWTPADSAWKSPDALIGLATGYNRGAYEARQIAKAGS